MVVVAGREAYSIDLAVAHIADYAASHSLTIRHYDLGGPDEIDVLDAVSTADLGRMVLINARLDGDDAARLLSFDLDLNELPIDLRITDMHIDSARSDPRYSAMERAWKGLVALHNIDRAKASKLLHLKRPKLFPILDSRIAEVYQSAAASEARRLGWNRPHYWSALAADVSANSGAFAAIRDLLSDAVPTRLLVHLTDLRLQDILAWKPVR